MANFFIDRPIFAWVLAILLCLTGTLAIFSLPVEQYPDLAPPNVRVTANYPGASAQTLENTVTQVIEQNMTGLDNLMYMSSQSSGTGQASVTLSFKAGTDPDEAVQQVQNQLQSAMRKLPQAVQNQGVTVRKTGDTNILTIAFVSTDGSMDKQDIADYVASNIQDPLSRVNGVGDIDAYGSQYSMRIWLDPAKLNSFQMTAKDVTDAIESQNAQIAVGQLGGTPSVDKQALNATINAQSLLQTPEQFRDITLRVNQDGSEVRLGDVATVEMGAEKYDYLSRFNGKPASGLGVKLASGANEMATAELVLNRLDELAQYFPHGLEYKVAYETTSFVKASIEDVVKTLLEAIALVFLVMYLFLQNFRATLIPTIAVPVVLMGTFSVLYAFGYSVNTLTMFAMVLAIGLLVDDAIVVVENVERIMSEEGLTPREATRKSMGQIQGALVGIAMVLSAVFVPMAFFGGTTGAIYRQFSITIVAAMVLSVLVAMILTPALCATLLKPLKKGEHHGQKGFFAWFNQMFNRNAERYEKGVAKILHRSLRWIVIYVLLLGGMVPFSAFATSRWETGSPRLERYNGYSTVEIVGEAAPGVSTGTAMDIMESLVKQLPNGFGLEWTAMSYQERLSGAQAPALYAISLLVVFLCLAALYESWSVPFSVMLVVPLGVIGALLATWMRGLENDVYFQVGLLTVIGLSAKNAILIVEFANEMNQKGHDLFEATLHACRQRLRPILMTSLAFIFGVLPMATSTGAGSGGQHAVGTGVMGGMISATILAIYFVPLFFVLVRRRFPLKPRPE
ncbi:efflux RND transporter permease subunit [Escherichia coli]|uniref:efflux RND transporter permease subunit n=1 Tax=Escherichia coli TaxID=562 RepID=UPI001BCBE06D|nr:efflux RND transporter permease subunit [Escherichia coli]MBS4301612.1 efflux RND transporter permease subunit [Escherichia coli]MBS4377815.1 efflux RND transporter permease subunit [Escherichia coli]